MNKILKILPKIGKVLGLVFTGILVILLGIRLFVKDPQYYKDNKKQQKLIVDSISVINQNQLLLDKEIADLKIGQKMFYDVINQSNQNQVQIQKEIKNLRKYFNEKINRVDRYNISDLDSFFRARYKQYYD